MSLYRLIVLIDIENRYNKTTNYKTTDNLKHCQIWIQIWSRWHSSDKIKGLIPVSQTQVAFRKNVCPTTEETNKILYTINKEIEIVIYYISFTNLLINCVKTVAKSVSESSSSVISPGVLVSSSEIISRKYFLTT